MTILALLAGSGGAVALEPGAAFQSYTQRQWTDVDGLPQNAVLSLVQARDGHLWMATSEGVVRFDGRRFTVFDSSNTPALRSSLIRVIHEGRDGTLWVGTFGGGLVRMRNGVWTALTTRDGLCDDDVRALDEDAEGTLWIATARGLNALGRDGTLRTWRADDGLPSEDLWEVLAADDGSVWIGTQSAGLARYRGGRFIPYTTRQGLPDNEISTLYQDARGTLWVGTQGGLARFAAGRFVPFTTADGLRDNWVFAVYRDRGGTLWIGTDDGTLHRRQGGRFVAYPLSPGTLDDSVQALVEDHEGNLWIGTRSGGLSRLSDRLISTLTLPDELSNESVFAVHQDQRGRLWIGTIDALVQVDDAASRIVSHDRVRAILEDRAGRLWVGITGGLKVLQNGRWKTYTPRDGLVDERVRALLEDGAGRLWIGTGRGLSVFDHGTFTSHTSADGILGEEVTALHESGDGTIWVATSDGGTTFRRDGRWVPMGPAQGLSDDHALSFHEDDDGTLWIGTHGGGLNRLQDGRIDVVRARDGLCDDVVFSIFEDDLGNFWTSSNKGLCRVRRRELEAFLAGRTRSVDAVSYGVADGMRSREANGGAAWQGRDGRLWFGTIRGVAAVDPRRLNRVPPPVSVTGVDLGEGWIPARRGLRISPGGRRDIQIRFTATSYRVPEKVRFRYRLEGHGRGWTDVGGQRVVTYDDLGPGEYRFRVTAANNDGVWSPRGASLAFEVVPRFYETLTFRILSAAALLALVVGAHRVRAWHLTRRLERLEHIVEARTAEVVAEKDKLGQANAELGRLNAQVFQAKAAVEQAHQDMLSLLDEMRLGVLILDRAGEATFSSRAAQDLLGISAEQARGRPWPALLGVDGDEKASVAEQLGRPPHRRSRVPVALGAAGTRPHWVEIEAQDHPRDAQRRILLLYDVAEVYDLRRLVDERTNFYGLIGQTGVMQLLFKAIRDVAPVEVAVLIEGETGTGKELVARAIHAASRRRRKPFIAVNCAGLTESLLSSQLFGHRRGAFTGAVADQMGYFEAADGGTLLLDEVGDLPPGVQSSLLRVLQENEIVRLGDARPRQVDVRVLAATHRDLEQEVAAERFRQDLLYRVRITRIQVPALRHRRDDIPLLANWFLAHTRATEDHAVDAIGAAAMKGLMGYAWPGNVRELKSAVESAVVACHGWAIQPEHLPREILEASPASDRGRPESAGTAELVAAAADLELPQGDERRRILVALDHTHGNRSAAARLLGISRATLYRRLRALGIEPPSVRQ